MTRIGMAVAAAALLVVACNRNETPEQAEARMAAETAAARNAIQAQGAKYAAAYTAQHPSETSAMFIQAGVMMPPNQPSVIGRDAIRASDSTFMSYGSTKLDLQTASVLANGPMAVEVGNYTFDFEPGKNAPKGMKAMKETGKYMVHWHNVNGEWLIAADAWSSNAPPMGAMSAEPAAKKSAPAKSAPAKKMAPARKK